MRRVRAIPVILATVMTIVPVWTESVAQAPPDSLRTIIASANIAASNGDSLLSATLWSRAANVWSTSNNRAQEGVARDSATKMFIGAGIRDSAFAQIGRRLAIDDSTIVRAVVQLQEGSPLLTANRGVSQEARFVGRVRQLLLSSSAAVLANDITSAEDAVEALEAMSSYRIVKATIRSTPAGMAVKYRKWSLRRSASALWTPVTTNTTVDIRPAAYQFAFIDPKSKQEKIVTVPCADSCTLDLPPPET